MGFVEHGHLADLDLLDLGLEDQGNDKDHADRKANQGLGQRTTPEADAQHSISILDWMSNSLKQKLKLVPKTILDTKVC